MKHILSKYLLFFFLMALLNGCDDDFMFSAKIKTANGITTVSNFKTGYLDNALLADALLIKKLAINDTINARDFKFMRDNMPNLKSLDLSNAVIAEYRGYEGTGGNLVYYYNAGCIPEYAFYNPEKPKGNQTFKTIIFPENLKSIKNYAFTKCGLSGQLTFPASLRDTIGISAFAYCENLTGIDFAATSFIGTSAFQSCSGLTGDIVLPDSVFTVKSWAFADCKNVNSVSIPSTLNEIESTAFCGCGGLFSVNTENQTYSAKDGVLYSYDETTLYQCPVSKTGILEVPSNIMSIATYAFANCTKLTNVILPSDLWFVEDNAFYGCTGLTGNFLIPASLFYIGLNVFEDCNNIQGFTIADNNTTFTFSDGVLTDISQMTIKRCLTSKTGEYVIPSDIMFIDNSAFSNCVNLTSLTIPESVLSLGKRAFFNCTGLTDIYVKSSVPIDMTDTGSAFELVNKDACTLHVPAGSVSAYLNAYVWNEFGNITEN